mmetsp:Transcript_74240/g.124959  ORF Transcript_74240/g.124959 Transcript_74240/m.124959 type:complete len:215 (+) Transcript_74240:692-1336(+)
MASPHPTPFSRLQAFARAHNAQRLRLLVPGAAFSSAIRGAKRKFSQETPQEIRIRGEMSGTTWNRGGRIAAEAVLRTSSGNGPTGALGLVCGVTVRGRASGLSNIDRSPCDAPQPPQRDSMYRGFKRRPPPEKLLRIPDGCAHRAISPPMRRRKCDIRPRPSMPGKGDGSRHRDAFCVTTTRVSVPASGHDVGHQSVSGLQTNTARCRAAGRNP